LQRLLELKPTRKINKLVNILSREGSRLGPGAFDSPEPWQRNGVRAYDALNPPTDPSVEPHLTPVSADVREVIEATDVLDLTEAFLDRGAVPEPGFQPDVVTVVGGDEGGR